MINNCLRLFPSLEANLEALHRLHLSLGFLNCPQLNQWTRPPAEPIGLRDMTRKHPRPPIDFEEDSHTSDHFTHFWTDIHTCFRPLRFPPASRGVSPATLPEVPAAPTDLLRSPVAWSCPTLSRWFYSLCCLTWASPISPVLPTKVNQNSWPSLRVASSGQRHRETIARAAESIDSVPMELGDNGHRRKTGSLIDATFFTRKPCHTTLEPITTQLFPITRAHHGRFVCHIVRLCGYSSSSRPTFTTSRGITRARYHSQWSRFVSINHQTLPFLFPAKGTTCDSRQLCQLCLILTAFFDEPGPFRTWYARGFIITSNWHICSQPSAWRISNEGQIFWWRTKLSRWRCGWDMHISRAQKATPTPDRCRPFW